MSEKIVAVLAKPGEDADMVEIDGSYEGLKSVIGGWLECIHLGGEVVAWIDEEGLLKGLPWNRRFDARGSCQVLAGPILVTGRDEEGETRGLTKVEALHVLWHFNVQAKKMDPTPSSLEEMERITGEPAMSITVMTPDGPRETWNSRDGDKE